MNSKIINERYLLQKNIELSFVPKNAQLSSLLILTITIRYAFRYFRYFNRLLLSHANV